MTDELKNLSPVQLRHLIRQGKYTDNTSGLAPGYTQANLVILPKDLAYDFLLFTQRNPKPCPVLEVSNAGSKKLTEMATDIDLANDFPKYRIYEKGELTQEVTSIDEYWRDDLVSFVIGCSFSFESELLAAGIEVRNITENVNVPMYDTNIPLKSAGQFHGNMVVSMRPIPQDQVVEAVKVTNAMPKVHGAPIQIGDPEYIGITDLDQPDYGDAVTINPGEVPVFWPCGVTPQNVIMQTKPDFVITHSPGHMLVTDVKNTELKYL
ncbi:putative hydro-lyase [Companilactobacillus zhongbaensis]|uniref:putative hydro-lyase n=1 Tax=Companilactobacillus zhongbaensis TaxID=2486009 RepID=UPI000F774141|nr:putative hydro-lyase [Companilactobacillus zhongbaensis]